MPRIDSLRAKDAGLIRIMLFQFTEDII